MRLDDARVEGYPVSGDLHPHDDPRWPTACACGYEFVRDDVWQLFHQALYAGPDGAMHVLNSAPVGAMWDATWFKGSSDYEGPDGKCLVVMTPGGEWMVDGPAKGGGKWTRSGEPPDVTVSPSILIQNPDGSERYHGWLTAGCLVPA